MKDQNMKIGILGGSFNPVHNGHLELAKQALAQFALDQIWLMPNHIPAYKKWDRSVTNEDRLHMVELAVKDHDRLRCSDLELQRAEVPIPLIHWHSYMNSIRIRNGISSWVGIRSLHLTAGENRTGYFLFLN